MHMCLMSTYPKSLCLPTLLQKGPISGSSWNGAFVHAVVHALSTLFQRRPVFSASVANQDPELESIWTLLDTAACGPAGLRAFRFIFVHALSTLCPRYFWHDVLDLFGELDPGCTREYLEQCYCHGSGCQPRVTGLVLDLGRCAH